MLPPSKTPFIILEILKFLNYRYFFKPIFWSKKKRYLLKNRGFCGDVMSQENQEYPYFKYSADSSLKFSISYYNNSFYLVKNV